jgi:hypothetical protein
MSADLESFLTDATARGSGDDITLGFIRCSEESDQASPRCRDEAAIDAT